LGDAVWPDDADIFERSPYAVYFQSTGAFDFILVDNHIQPSGTYKEISALPQVARYYQELWNDPDVFLVGDFNADGSYYDESLLAAVFPEDQFKIIITNEYDTTVAESENTYDRFIITPSALEDYTGNFGVLRLDEAYDFNQYHIKPKEVSDHYPVWAEFYIDRDTD
jgi:endonuclease/exonuclease/phosphatase family metal-dependent hydrolase